MGCWKNGYMAFQGPGTSSYTQMTLRYCIRKCQSYGINLVGLEVSQFILFVLSYDVAGVTGVK